MNKFIKIFLLVVAFSVLSIGASTFISSAATQSIQDNFGVTCNTPGGGQLCADSYDSNFTMTNSGTVDASYHVGNGHCSAIRIYTYVDGNLVDTTPDLGWQDNNATDGSSDPQHRPIDATLLDNFSLPAGKHTLSLVAEGITGGCNGGTLFAWGGPFDMEIHEASANPSPQCSDGTDNDNDTFTDSDDAGCHVDGNAGNPNSYDPNDNDETNAAAANVGPNANAGSDETITMPTNSVTLDGSASTDSDGTIVSYVWDWVSGPSGVDPADTASSSASGLVAGTYVFKLTVTDDDGASSSDEVVITANPNCPVCHANIPPVADAGADQTITLPTNSANLNGSASSDSDGTITSYVWNWVSGPSGINPADTVSPTVSGMVAGTYVFELTVTDNDNASDSDTVSITVNPASGGGCNNNCNTPPECQDGADNDGDNLTDSFDPGCHVDGNAGNPNSYDPNDDSELNAGNTSTVKMCKANQNQAHLSGWQLMLLGDKVGSVDVNPDGNTYKINNIPAGHYVLKASGQYIYGAGDSTTPGGAFSDAAYSQRIPSEPEYGGPFVPWVRENNFPAPWQGALGIIYNNSFTDWGSTFNPAHVYALGTTTTSTSDFLFKSIDNYYLDNVGHLTVDAYKGYTGMTGNDGCVEFLNVPYGTYTADEIMKKDWTNVSGLGQVVVDQPTETFNVVNRENNNPPPLPQCSDSADNDGDHLIDANDPGCHSDGNPTNTNSYVPSDNNETDVPECSNTGDDDNDGKIDALDPGCHSDGNAGNPNSYVPTDDDETNVPQCSNTRDDDGDTLIDTLDPGCHTDGNATNTNSYDPNDDNETNGALPQCSDGIDNDGDNKIDYPADNGCDNSKDDNETSHSGGGGHRSHGGSGGRAATPPGEVLGESTSCGIYVDKYLRRGYANDVDSVKEVQQFLNDYMHEHLAVDGIYGIQTEAAVRRFQLAHNDKILKPWGIPGQSTGIFYLTTQTETNNIMCPTLELPIPSNLIPFSANPQTPAPLYHNIV